MLNRKLCRLLHTFNPETLKCDRDQRQCKRLCNEVNEDGRPQCGLDDEGCCVAHPTNCNYFYKCSDEERTLSKCPAGSGFNDNKFTCVKDFKCNNEKKLETTPKLCTENINTITCKEDCNGPEITPCSQDYYRCKDGQRFTEMCPRYTRFNEITRKCDKETYLQQKCYSSNPILCNGFHTLDTEIPTTTVKTTTEDTDSSTETVEVSKDEATSNENDKSPPAAQPKKKRKIQKKFNAVFGGTLIKNRNNTGRTFLGNLFRRPNINRSRGNNNKNIDNDQNKEIE